MNQQRITAIAAGSPATAEEARELAGMAMCRPLETCFWHDAGHCAALKSPCACPQILGILRVDDMGQPSVWPLPAAPNKEN
jgi:hypothetical protein